MGEMAVLDLQSVFGLLAKVTASSRPTGGAYEMDCTAAAGSGTMVHYHLEQEEVFRVLEGTLEVLQEGSGAPSARASPTQCPKAWCMPGAARGERASTSTVRRLASKITLRRWTGWSGQAKCVGRRTRAR